MHKFLECEELEYAESPLSEDANIGACVMLESHDMNITRSALAEWLTYHRLIGVEHFWVYVTELWTSEHRPTNILMLPYVTYIPYNFVWRDHWAHSSFRAPFHNFWQVAMQHQCIFRAKRHKLKWVTTTDIDEYIRLPGRHSSIAPLMDVI